MKFALTFLVLLIGFTAYDYSQPATCHKSIDISIAGRMGLYLKCQTPWGVYYKESLVRYVD